MVHPVIVYGASRHKGESRGNSGGTITPIAHLLRSAIATPHLYIYISPSFRAFFFRWRKRRKKSEKKTAEFLRTRAFLLRHEVRAHVQ